MVVVGGWEYTICGKNLCNIKFVATFVYEMVKLLLCYIAVINLVTLVVYGFDKYKSCHRKWRRMRTPESTLLLLAAMGGSVGALLAMLCFRHKTRHKKFYIGVPVILLAHAAIAVCYLADSY